MGFLLRIAKRIGDRFMGTRVDEFYWKYRHILFFWHPKRWWANNLTDEAMYHPSKGMLINSIKKHIPFETIFEVGTGNGINLIRLNRELPNARLYGMDISPYAINEGVKYVRKEKLDIIFWIGKAENIKAPKNIFDLVFTDATLVCIGPDLIEKAIFEIFRVARKTVIFMEWYVEGKSQYHDHWTHDYLELIKPYKYKKVSMTKIPPKVWGGNWGKYGQIIEVSL